MKNISRLEIENIYGKISPFEFKNKLIELATLSNRKSTRTLLDAGRGNPNWIASTPREAFFTFGQFAITESRYTWDDGDLTGMPKKTGIYKRFCTYVENNKFMPGIDTLKAIIDYGIEELNFDKDEFLHELTDAIIGDNYPFPDRMLIHIEKIVKEYLKREMKYDVEKGGEFNVFAVEGATAARLIGSKVETGGKIEFLLLKRTEDDTWETLVKPGKRAKIGARFSFGDGKLIAEVVGMGEDGARIVKFEYNGIFEEILDELGNMPLPPYITEKLDERERYQTVYSKHNGSAAAPTAGLHFTEELLAKIKEKGVDLAFVTLHVGLGTFRPVKVDDVDNHQMHSEFYMVTQEAADKINKAKANGNRVISVGTTSTRTIESVADENGIVKATSGWTNIFIYPGYKWKVIDNLITNFHLPESTLIMLVSSLAGKEHVLNAYNEAVKERYRFFSFGDAM